MSGSQRPSSLTGPAIPPSGTPIVDAERLRRLFDAVPALVSVVDASFVYQYVNRSYSEWFGPPAESIVGRPMAAVLGEDTFAIVRPRLEAALAGETVTYEAMLPYRFGGSR